jgi:hypothetical protein
LVREVTRLVNDKWSKFKPWEKRRNAGGIKFNLRRQLTWKTPNAKRLDALGGDTFLSNKKLRFKREQALRLQNKALANLF